MIAVEVNMVLIVGNLMPPGANPAPTSPTPPVSSITSSGYFNTQKAFSQMLPTLPTIPLSSSPQEDIEETVRNNVLIKRVRRKNNQIHCLTGPASEEFYYPSGNIRIRWYYINDKLHKVNEPAMIIYFEDGRESEVAYYLNNMMHNKNGPAYSSFYDNGAQNKIIWCVNGYYFNHQSPNSPAYITFYKSGQVKCQQYYSKVKTKKASHITNLDRDFNIGPAEICYHENGQFKQEVFRKNGKFHNLLGPAIIDYDECGKICGKPQYYINNKFYSDKQAWATDAAIELKKLAQEEKNKVTVAEVKKSSIDGCYCRKCGSYEKYIGPDGPDGKVTCWGCKAWG